MRHNSYIIIDEKAEKELYAFIENSIKARDKRRAMGIMMNSQKISVFEIANKLSVGADAVYDWLVRYRSIGIKGLIDKPKSGRSKKLKKENEESIKKVLKKSS